MSRKDSDDAPAACNGAPGSPCDGELDGVVNVDRASLAVAELIEKVPRQKKPKPRIAVALGLEGRGGLGFRGVVGEANHGVPFIGSRHAGLARSQIESEIATIQFWRLKGIQDAILLVLDAGR